MSSVLSYASNIVTIHAIWMYGLKATIGIALFLSKMKNMDSWNWNWDWLKKANGFENLSIFYRCEPNPTFLAERVGLEKLGQAHNCHFLWNLRKNYFYFVQNDMSILNKYPFLNLSWYPLKNPIFFKLQSNSQWIENQEILHNLAITQTVHPFMNIFWEF